MCAKQIILARMARLGRNLIGFNREIAIRAIRAKFSTLYRISAYGNGGK